MKVTTKITLFCSYTVFCKQVPFAFFQMVSLRKCPKNKTNKNKTTPKTFFYKDLYDSVFCNSFYSGFNFR